MCVKCKELYIGLIDMDQTDICLIEMSLIDIGLIDMGLNRHRSNRQELLRHITDIYRIT